MPSLTVVVPTIGRPTLDVTLRSIMAQTLPVEFIVVSDLDHRGAGPTMNRGASIARTDYVGFVADDDRLDTRYHEWFEWENRTARADLFLFKMRYEGGGTLPTTTTPAELHLGGAGGSFIVRRSLLWEHSFITEDAPNHVHEDWEMIEWCRQNDKRIHVDERIAYYVRH